MKELIKDSLVFFYIFGLTNVIVFLHIGHPLRRLISGVKDHEFKRRIEDYKLYSYRSLYYPGFRIVYLGRMIRCHACTGFWVGFIFKMLKYEGSYYINIWEWVGTSFVFGILCSIFCFILWVVLVKLGADKL